MKIYYLILPRHRGMVMIINLPRDRGIVMINNNIINIIKTKNKQKEMCNDGENEETYIRKIKKITRKKNKLTYTEDKNYEENYIYKEEKDIMKKVNDEYDNDDLKIIEKHTKQVIKLEIRR